MAEKTGIYEEMKSAIDDPETRLGDAQPGTPFALIAFSYLVVLTIVCGLIAIVYWGAWT